ncbi:AMP-binding protein [Neorhizobium sp. NPDC001467]|uniref:AMP-binding protein n=1 Tax=Neorhizobium sp. NPDC001467 TaxID=3390595 RepID=UPI003D06A316
MSSRYTDIYQQWQDDPDTHWTNAARDITWFRPPERIFDADQGVYGRWFVGGLCNICYNCVDRHIAAGRGQDPAIIFDSAMTGISQVFSFDAVLQEVTAIAAVMRNLGIEKGDRVVIYMPMVPEAVFSMLACARLGAIHSVVFGGFAAQELASRLDSAGAKLVVTASCGLEPGRVVAYKPLLDGAIELARTKPANCLILQREQLSADLDPDRGEHDFAELAAVQRAAKTRVDCVPMASTDPLYILYTSGTTGKPKGVVRDTGGHMVALHWSMRNIYGLQAGDISWTASDIGWVVGHSYIVYGPLLAGVVTVLFEGKPVGTPDAGTFWRVVERYGVNVLFTAPTAIRAIRRDDPNGRLAGGRNLSSLRTLFLAGERADPETLHWAATLLGIPVIDNWWQTETGWPIAANPMGLGPLPVKPGSPTVPMPGFTVAVLDDSGHRTSPDALGNLAIRLPLPPGCLTTYWEADDLFHEACLSEFPGYYKTADAGRIDEDGYVFVMARTDDIINCAGHRLSTGALEEVCACHPDVAECAVVGVADPIKGQVPCGFLVLKSGTMRGGPDVCQDVIDLVRQRIGAVAAFRKVVIVAKLPKTRSGKILRATIQKIADRQSWSMPATIEDPATLQAVAVALREDVYVSKKQ